MAIFGVLILCVSTIPLAFVGAHSSILAISLVLAVRGLGIGLSFMPTMTAAFNALRTDQLSLADAGSGIGSCPSAAGVALNASGKRSTSGKWSVPW